VDLIRPTVGVPGALRLRLVRRSGRRIPGAVELAAARRRREAAERRTRALAVVALATTSAVGAGEVARVWRRGSAPSPIVADAVLPAAAEAVTETVHVAVTGYREGTERENAVLNLLGSFTVTFAMARLSTHVIRRRGRFGPFRDVRYGEHHVHHFVPGIALAFLTGGAGLVMRDKRVGRWLALPFGTGVALTLDESALLLKLDDVYWTEEGIVSVQITFAALAMLSALALVLRTLRRGERTVLPESEPWVRQGNGRAPRVWTGPRA
jgi:hypothetical protein